MRVGSKVRLDGELHRVLHIDMGLAWVYPYARGCNAAAHRLVPVSSLEEVGGLLPSFGQRRSGGD